MWLRIMFFTDDFVEWGSLKKIYKKIFSLSLFLS